MNEQNKKIIEVLRHELHAHPELALQERETKKILQRFLKKYTSWDIVDCGPYFYGKLSSGVNRPAIAFRGEMDAVNIPDNIKADYRSLNSYGHKCGHDGHAAALCGLALELEEQKPDRDVILVFQPGEETGEGALLAREIFQKEDIGEIYAVHNAPGFPLGSIVLKEGTMEYASEGLTLYLKGKSSHAGEPEKGINPAYAIAALVQKMNEGLYSDFKGQAYITIIQIRVGEKNFGISPGEGVLRLTIRAEIHEELKELEERIVRETKVIARSHGLRLRITRQDVFPETRNSAEGVHKIREAASRLGLKVLELKEAERSSEDFGWFLEERPGAIALVGAGEDHPDLHTEEYDFPDEILPVIVDLFTELAKM